MPNPFTVGCLALFVTCIVFIEWIVFEPAFHAMEATSIMYSNDQALPLINTLHYTCYLLPIGISIGLWIWAFLAVIRRQVVTQPGY